MTIIKMHCITVKFDYNKYKTFPQYRERWIQMIDVQFGLNCKYDLTIDDGNFISKYNYISFEELQMIVNEL